MISVQTCWRERYFSDNRRKNLDVYKRQTSYRPGTRFGSSAIRHESYGIESYSPYQDLDLFDGDVTDIGDIELPFGSSEAALDAITDQTRRILHSHKRPFMLGGEHLVTLGAFRAVFEKFPDVHIIHFDAHADLRLSLIHI